MRGKTFRYFEWQLTKTHLCKWRGYVVITLPSHCTQPHPDALELSLPLRNPY